MFKENSDKLHQWFDMLVYENVRMKEQTEDLISRVNESEEQQQQ